jgi:hypothetical protein
MAPRLLVVTWTVTEKVNSNFWTRVVNKVHRFDSWLNGRQPWTLQDRIGKIYFIFVHAIYPLSKSGQFEYHGKYEVANMINRRTVECLVVFVANSC